jgi:hypothetical protein
LRYSIWAKLPSVALYRVELTFSGVFESYLRSHFLVPALDGAKSKDFCACITRTNYASLGG